MDIVIMYSVVAMSKDDNIVRISKVLMLDSSRKFHFCINLILTNV